MSRARRVGRGRFAIALAIGVLVSVPASAGQPRVEDWLAGRVGFPARATPSDDGARLVLENGLVRRIFRLRPDGACVALDDLVTGASLLRAVRPEARLVLDGQPFDVGGLHGQSDEAFLLPAWEAGLEADPEALHLSGYVVGPIEERLAWAQVRHHAPDACWPPSGVHVRFDYVPGASLPGREGLVLSVHYELYDDLPLFGKWVTMSNGSAAPVELDRLTTEILAVVEEESRVETRAGVPLPVPSSLVVQTDFAFGGFGPENAQRHVVHWRPDPAYETQVNFLKLTPCLLEVEPERGPDVIVGPGGTFTSWRTFELVPGSSERERRGLAQRRMTRVLAPWVTENPLVLHVVSVDPDVVRTAIDQAAECGFEMVSLSFGSGLDMEDDSPANLAKFAGLAAYAAQHGIELGGYSLLSSRRIEPDSDNCINPETGAPGGQTHGFCPALASAWGQDYFRCLRTFFEATGFLQFTHDGSYPGDFDAAARPPLQRGLDDSQWVQWNVIADFYRWLRGRGVYLRVPDSYQLVGSNEIGMGYRETNWSLPRALQVLHTRQNVYDGTWLKPPSMGWMFVPLTQYHGGGEAATIEPLDEHLDHYEQMLASNLGLGVQAVYRGTRLYDTPRVRDAVVAWVEWYRRWRDILESDVLHGRRADGRDLDFMVHCNPRLPERAMVVVFNPLDVDVTRTLRVPLWAAGPGPTVRVATGVAPALVPGDERELEVDDDGSVELALLVPARRMLYVVVR